MVIPDQIIDKTKGRVSTFFGDGIVAHVGFAEPFCPYMTEALHRGSEKIGAKVHPTGTYVVMEGPQFSTKAESHMYRSWGADVIGMTALPEAKLAREAEICYAILACSTDYDCWHESETPVTVEMVVANLNKNTSLSKAILADVIPSLSEERNCSCGSALENTIITAREAIPTEALGRLALLVDKYLK
jgi:5'-methylthioadenosine phosphorylase